MLRPLFPLIVLAVLTACTQAPQVSMAPAEPVDYGRVAATVDAGEVADARSLLEMVRDGPVAGRRANLADVASDSLECWAEGPTPDMPGLIDGREASACRDDFYAAMIALRGLTDQSAQPAQSAMR